MNTLCVISARGGSRGLPNKNINTLLGKPLIAWSIEHALATPEIDKVVVSTDSMKIAHIAKEAGAEVPFLRPKFLSNAEIGKWKVFQHALHACEEYYQETFDLYIDLDCTNPLREVADISACIEQFKRSQARGVEGVFSICSARKNPYFNMLETDSSGALEICKGLPDAIVRRQDAPPVYEHVASIYALSTDYVRRVDNLLEGHTEGYNIGIDKSLDIDSAFDFLLVEFLMKQKLELQNAN